MATPAVTGWLVPATGLPMVALVVALVTAVILILGGRASRDREANAVLALRARRPDPGRPAAARVRSSRVEPRRWQRWPRWGRFRRWGAGPTGPQARAPTTEEVAASMVLLAVALQSGCGVVEAIEHTAQVAPPVAAAELAVVAAGLRWGVAELRAWDEVDPRWSRAALALRLAREAGVAPSSLLLSGAEDLRSTRLAAVDVAAARLGVRLVIPLGVAFLPAFVLTTVLPVVLALARQVLSS